MATIAMKKKVDKSKSMSIIMMGLSFRFSWKNNSKNKEYLSNVHSRIPCELSKAWEKARPYRPSLVLNLQTITEEEDPCKTPLLRTPLYFKGTNAKPFRFSLRRGAKLMWRVHYAARLRRKFTNVLRLFRITRDTEPHAVSGLSGMQI